MPIDPATGVMSMSVPLATLPGPPGFALSLDYLSSVARDVSTWNEDAPTGLVGLGWQLAHPRIVRQPMHTGARGDDVFALVAGTSTLRLQHVRDIEWTSTRRVSEYRTTDLGFTRITRAEEFTADGVLTRDEWTVVSIDGATQRFGAEVTHDDGVLAATNASVGWIVTWDGWVGQSTTVVAGAQRVQRQEAIEWNLTSVEDIYGNRVDLTYAADLMPVGAPTGLPYTRASYLTSVRASSGWRAELDYAPKDPREYPAIAVHEGGFVLDQLQVSTRYVTEARVCRDTDWDRATIVGRAVLGYGDESSFLNPEVPTMSKRLLRSVTQLSGAGDELAPPTLFSYYGEGADTAPFHVGPLTSESTIFDSRSGGLFGALRSVTDAAGAVTTIRYDRAEHGSHTSDTYSWRPGHLVDFPAAHHAQTFFGNDYVVVVTSAETELVIPEDTAYLGFALYDCSGDEWVEVWKHDVVLKDHLLSTNTSKYRVLCAPDFVVIAVDEGIVKDSTRPALIMARSPLDPSSWRAVVETSPKDLIFPEHQFTRAGQSVVGCGNGVAAVLTTKQVHDGHADAVLHLYRRLGEEWTHEQHLVPARSRFLGLNLDLAVFGSTVAVATSPASLIQVDEKTQLHAFTNTYTGWAQHAVIELKTPVPDFDLSFVHYAVELRAEQNRIGCIWWHRNVDGVGPELAIAMATIDFRDLDAPQNAKHVVRNVFGPMVVAIEPTVMPWDDNFDVTVKMTSETIRVSTYPNPLLGIHVWHFDGVAWRGPKRIGQDMPFNVYDKAALFGAANLELVPVGPNLYDVVHFDAVRNEWVSTGIQAEGAALANYLGDAALQVLQNALWFVPVVGPLSTLALMAVDSMLSLVIAWFDSKQLVVAADLGSERTVIIANQHEDDIQLWRRSGTTYELVDSSAPPVPVPYRYTVQSEYGLGFPHPHDHQSGYVVPLRNGRLQFAERIRAYDEAATDRIDVVVGQYGNLFAIVAATGQSLREYPVPPLRWRFAKVGEGTATGPFRSYQAVSLTVADGYQHTTVDYAFDPVGHVALPSVGGGLFAHSSQRQAGAGNGVVESSFYTSVAGSGPSFPGAHDPANAPAVVAGQAYLVRQRAVDGTTVAEHRQELAVYKQPSASVVRTTTRTVRTVDTLDGVTTVSETEWDMAVSGQAKSTRQYTGAPVASPSEIAGEWQSEDVTYGFEVQPYALELRQLNLLTPSVRSASVQHAVRSGDPHRPVARTVDVEAWSAWLAPGGAASSNRPPAGYLARGTELTVPYVVDGHLRFEYLAFDADGTFDGRMWVTTTAPLDAARTPHPRLQLISGERVYAPLALVGASVAVTDSGAVAVLAAHGDEAGFVIAAAATVQTDSPAQLLFPFVVRPRNSPPGAVLAAAVSANVIVYGTIAASHTKITPFACHTVALAPESAICAAPALVEGHSGGRSAVIPYVAAGQPHLVLYDGAALSTPTELDVTPAGVTGVIEGSGRVWDRLAFVASAGGAWQLVIAEIQPSTAVVTARLPLDFVPDPMSLVVSGDRIALIDTSQRLHQFRAETARIVRTAPAAAMPGAVVGTPVFRADGTIAVALSDAADRTDGCVVVDGAGLVLWRWQDVGLSALAPVEAAGDELYFVGTLAHTNGNVIVEQVRGTAAELIDVTRSVAHTWDVETRSFRDAYLWKGTGTAEFPFRLPQSAANYQDDGGVRVVERGVPLETADALGERSSVVYDTTLTLEVASFPGASLSHGEGRYVGFEAYESPAYHATDALVSDEDSFTGERALLLKPGSTVETLTARNPLARRIDRVVVSGQLRSTSLPTATVAVEVLLRDDTGAELVVARSEIAASEEWTPLALVAELPASAVGQHIVVRLTAGAAAILLDHLWYAPLGCPVTATTYDPAYAQPTSMVNQRGDVTRTAYGLRRQLVASADVTGQVLSLALSAPARWNSAGGDFDPGRPNAAYSAVARRGGRLFLFRSQHAFARSGWHGGEWTPDGVRISSGTEFRYDTETSELSRGVRVQLDRVTDGSPAVSVGVVRVAYEPVESSYEIRVGDHVSRVPGPWDSDWTILTMSAEAEVDENQEVTGSSGDAPALAVYVVVGNRVLFADSVTAAPQPGVVTVSATHGHINVRNVAVIDGVVVSAQFADATGRTRQAQSHETNASVIVDSETLYNAAGQAAFVTKPTRKSAGAHKVGAVAFEPDYVEGRDPAAFAPIWRTDPTDPNRAKLLGRIVDWAAQSYPDSADQAPYAYAGAYHEHAPMSRVVETTQSHEEYIVGTAHAGRVHYGRTDDTDMLLRVSATGTSEVDAGRYSVETRREALSDTEFRYVVTMSDATGNRSVSGVGYGESPFGPDGKPADQPHFLATVVEQDYLHDGTTISKKYPPNFFQPRIDDDRYGYVQTDAVSPTGAALWTASSDTGRSQVVCAPTNRPVFTQDADGAAAGWFSYSRTDLLGRTVSAGLIADRFDRAVLNSVAALPPGSLDSGLVGSWPLQDITHGGVTPDVSGAHLDATLLGSAEASRLTWSSPNDVCTSIDVIAGSDGTGSGGIALPGLTVALRSIEDALTLSAWVRLQADGASHRTVFAVQDSPTSVTVTVTGGQWQVEVAAAGERYASRTPLRPGDVGSWVHVALVAAGARWQLYLDGTPAGAPLQAASFARSANGVWTIGCQAPQGLGIVPLTGFVADIRLYRRALSRADVAALRLRALERESVSSSYDCGPDGRPSVAANGAVGIAIKQNWPIDTALDDRLAARFRFDEGGTARTVTGTVGNADVLAVLSSASELRWVADGSERSGLVRGERRRQGRRPDEGRGAGCRTEVGDQHLVPHSGGVPGHRRAGGSLDRFWRGLRVGVPAAACGQGGIRYDIGRDVRARRRRGAKRYRLAPCRR